MPSALHGQDMADMLVGTLRELGPPKFSQIAQRLTEYEVMGRWLKEDRVLFESGYGIRRTLLAKTQEVAEFTGLHGTITPNQTDHLATMKVDWVHPQTHWVYERREKLMNTGQSMINDIIKPRRFNAMLSMAEILETSAWASPAADTYLEPFGIPHWIVKNNSTGHNGGLPGSWSTVANVNLTTYPKFKNYTGQYTDLTKADAIAMLRTAHRMTAFKSPVDIPEYRGARGSRYRIYVNEATISQMETIGEQQNENLGRDLAPYDGSITFKRHPIRYIAQLDADTTNPIYFIDHESFHPVVLKGDYLYEHRPVQGANQPNTWYIVVDLSFNFICIDRRRNAVLATDTTMP